MTPEDLIPIGACRCGCGRPVSRRFVKGHGGHSGGPPPIAVTETDCWEWTGKRDPHGYGRLRRDGRDWLAHRWVYSRLVRPLSASDVLDHLCRNPSCVNPEHLEPVTDAENARRGCRTKLTAEQAAHIRKCWLDGGQFFVSQRQYARECAENYGVVAGTIRDILSGRTWAEPKLREAA